MSSFGFQWHLTDRCNLRCAHCYQESFSPKDELGLDHLKRMAHRIFEAIPERPVSINLTGGEPLVLKHIFDLMDHLRTFPNLEEINLITNGTKHSDELIERLRDQPRIGSIKVSVESSDEAINDSIRGRGSFRRVSQGIERLLGTGKPVVIMATLSRVNLGQISRIVEMARHQGVNGLIFERFVPLGRGRGITDQVLDACQWREAVQGIARASGLDIEAEELSAYRAFWLDLEPTGEVELRGALCNLGDQSMALMPDGTVFPCRRFPLPLGNVLDESFEIILSRLARFSADALGPRLRGELCGICGVEGCAGCRALAFALSGDFLSDDPQCLMLSD